MLVDSHCHLDYLAADGDLEGEWPELEFLYQAEN